MFTRTESKSTLSSLWRARTRAVLTGIAFFIPGFAFSLFITIPWANHHYGGDAQAALGALGPSFYVGIIAAIGCCIYLLRKASREQRR